MDYCSKTWLIKFTLGNYHILTFRNPPSHFTHILGNHILQIVQMEKNLSVSVDSNVSFENHMATKIAEQMVRLIHKTFLDADLFRRLFIILVRSNLEYAHPICSPHLKKHIKNIELSIPCNQIDQIVSIILSTRRDYCGAELTNNNLLSPKGRHDCSFQTSSLLLQVLRQPDSRSTTSMVLWFRKWTTRGRTQLVLHQKRKK